MIYTEIKLSWYLPKLPIPIKVPTMDGYKIEYMDDMIYYKIISHKYKGNISDEELTLEKLKLQFPHYPNLELRSIERYYYDNDGKKILE